MSDLFSICRFPFRMLALAALLCLNGCDKGEDIENQAPETRISVEAINFIQGKTDSTAWSKSNGGERIQMDM